MSATLPPAAERDRPSDFGEFWQHAETAARPASVAPEPEEQGHSSPLTPEQRARRERYRRAVGGIILSLLAFTALAASVYVTRRAAARSAEAERVTPASHAPRAAEEAPAVVSTATPVATPPAPSAADQALSLARTPVATIANLQTWSRLVEQLSAEDRKRFEHELSRSSITGPRATQEAARLQLALLWRASSRRAKAQKVLVSLARTATDPVVKKYALGALTAA